MSFEGQNTIIPPVTTGVTNNAQNTNERAKEPSKRLFFVLFEDTGTESDKIVSADARSFYNYAEAQFQALENCEVDKNLEGDEEIETALESSGVKALAVFEVPDNIDLTELQKQSVSSHLLPAILKDVEKVDLETGKSLTAPQG